jgi:hypothetical protein
MLVVTKHKVEEAAKLNPMAKLIIEEFAGDKKQWWNKQHYIQDYESFGSEFAVDLIRKDLKRVRKIYNHKTGF